jgi:hypothetical protein
MTALCASGEAWRACPLDTFSSEEVEHLAESQYLSIATSKSGRAVRQCALLAVPKISKNFATQSVQPLSPSSWAANSLAKAEQEH